MGRAFGGYAGSDPRIWVAMATVDSPDESGEQAIEFDEEDGQVYVGVTLQPYNIPVRARVGMFAAGAGEASYDPFVPNDEVVVVIPSGVVREGCVIVSRLNNAFDPFPFGGVAGADPTKNSIAFLRTRAALTLESAASVMIRSAAAGAFLRLDGKGNVTLRDGSKGALQMSADAFSYLSGDGTAFLRIDLVAKRYSFQVGTATLTLSGDTADAQTGGRSQLAVPGPLTIATGGNTMVTAVEHVLTTEAFANLLVQFFVALGAAIPGPLTGAGVAALVTVPGPTNLASLMVQAAALAPLEQSIAQTIFAAFNAAVVKPAGVPGFGQLAPGIGSAGTLTG